MKASKGPEQNKRTDWGKLEIVHPNAAGIDIGGREHFVAVAPDCDDKPVRSFGCFTCDLHAIADWLLSRNVTSVVMQSTGSYWVPVFEILEQRGLEVYLVNPRNTKSLPGRKSDVAECQWLLKLHTYGLLSNSFQPPDAVRTMRTIWRQRGMLTGQASSSIQRMQKVPTEMNVQLATVLSDLSGYSGMAIVKAIVDGKRDPRALAELADPQVKASREDIARSLEGNWREELVFVLDQELDLYGTFRGKIEECDRRLQMHLATLDSKVDIQSHPLGPRRKGKKASKKAPRFDLRSELYRISGVDWTRVDGIDVGVAQAVIAEVGVELSRFPREGNFVSWLGLCPQNDVSGGKVLRRGTAKVASRAALAFRQAASTLRSSKSYLGAQFRRFRAKLGAPKAITAMAAKLARLFYRLLTFGQEYVDRGEEYYEERYREQQVKMLQKKARQLGFQVLPVAVEG